MLNHGNTLVQLLHCLLLSPCQLYSTVPPTAQLLLSQSQQGNLVGRHLWLSNVLERVSQSNCEPHYVTNTSHHKWETFLYEYPLHWVLLHTKDAQQNTTFSSTLLKNGHHFDYWNRPLNLCMPICYLDCHEAGLCCYLVIHIENLLCPLQLFTYICDLFADTALYFVIL
jgi:hypothetical protein